MTTPTPEEYTALVKRIEAVAVGWGVMRERGEHTRTEMNDIKETLRQEVSARRRGHA